MRLDMQTVNGASGLRSEVAYEKLTDEFYVISEPNFEEMSAKSSTPKPPSGILKTPKETIKKSSGLKKKPNVTGCIYSMEDDDYDYDDLDRTLYSDLSMTCRLHDLLCALVNQSRSLASQLQQQPQSASASPSAASVGAAPSSSAAGSPSLLLGQALEAFVRTHSLAIYGDGPLPVAFRHYFALLAAERFKCPSLICLHRCEFLRNGGDPEWLAAANGRMPGQVPPRVRNIQELNKKMAHRPWAVTSQLISNLRHCPDALLTAPQLAHAIVIFAQTHSLAVFMAGCQLYSADVTPTICQWASRSNIVGPQSTSTTSGIVIDPSRRSVPSALPSMLLKQPLSVARSTVCRNNRANYVAWRFGVAQPGVCDKCVSSFVENDDVAFHDLRPCPYNNNNNNVNNNGGGTKSSVVSFSAPPSGRVYGLMYDWMDVRAVVFEHVYETVSESLDAEFKLVQRLFRDVTYFSESDESELVEQLAITRHDHQYAVWQFVHFLFGVYEDNVDYAKVRRVLSRELKTYIKLVVCFPSRAANKKFAHILSSVPGYDLVELNVLLMEARQNVELIYSVNALASLIGQQC